MKKLRPAPVVLGIVAVRQTLLLLFDFGAVLAILVVYAAIICGLTLLAPYHLLMP